MVTTIPERRLTDLETLVWRSERHTGRLPAAALLMPLDAAPDWNRLRDFHERAIRLAPRMRERVLDPAVPVGPAAWVPDEDFDLDRHLRRVRLPAPGDTARLLAFAEEAAAEPLDRDHPLWAGILIEGLPQGRAAYLVKVHHFLTGGLGDVPLVSLLPSRRRKHTPEKPAAGPRSVAARLGATTGAVIRSDPRSLALADIARQTLTLPLATGRLLAAGAQAFTHPGTAAASGLRLAVSLRRAAARPVAGSPLFDGRAGAAWRFGVLECPLDDLRAAARASGGSVTDAYLAALLGGVRRYHERHGVEIEELPVAMPDAAWPGPVFGAPTGILDPAERIAAIRGITMTLRAESTTDGLAMLAPLLNRLPGAVGATARQFVRPADLTVSHRPGAPGPAYLAGAKVERVYPLGPTPGSAVTAAMLAQDGTCCIGLTMDGTVVSDPDVLVGCVGSGLKEVLALG